jgi:hypothetical protein
MSPARFVEFLIVGMNGFMLIAFLAWRFVGPGKPNYPDRALDSVTNKDVSTDE